jgi:putative DNA primase/helicase
MAIPSPEHDNEKGDTNMPKAPSAFNEFPDDDLDMTTEAIPEEEIPADSDDDITAEQPNTEQPNTRHSAFSGDGYTLEDGTVLSNITAEAYDKLAMPKTSVKRAYETNKRCDIQYQCPPAVISRRIIADYFTHEFFADRDNNVLQPDAPQTPEDLSIVVLERINQATMIRNAMAQSVYGKKASPKDYMYPLAKRLSPTDVAHIMLHRYYIVNIATAERNIDQDLSMLSMYDDDPNSTSYGLYVNSNSYIERAIQDLSYDLTTHEVGNAMSYIRTHANHTVRGTDRDLVAVNNGIFNYRTKKLHNFHPGYIFMSKSWVNFNPDAEKPMLTHESDPDYTFDIEEWMLDLADGDEELADTLWQIIGAVIRPYVSWNKAAFFYSAVGNNGKGTLVELMRNLCGPGTYASIPLCDMGKDFMLEPLTRASAILVDENDVGGYVDRAANLKAIVTNDVISINRKYRSPISYQFYGFMVQCLNDMPQFKDKSESFYRRQLFIPFKKSFTGAERRFIKDEYMSNDAVLEYVLKRVLMDMDDYYELNAPKAALDVLAEFKLNNDPVRNFWEETYSEYAWDLLPFTFLYDMYKEWLHRSIPNAVPAGRNKFIKQLIEVNNSYADSPWEVPTNNGGRIRTGSRMNVPEPLIGEYKLTNWENETVGKSATNRYRPETKDSYNGFIRTQNATPQGVPASTVADDNASDKTDTQANDNAQVTSANTANTSNQLVSATATATTADRTDNNAQPAVSDTLQHTAQQTPPQHPNAEIIQTLAPDNDPVAGSTTNSNKAHPSTSQAPSDQYRNDNNATIDPQEDDVPPEV